MKGFINTIRTGIFTVAVAGVVAPLTALAGDHGGSGGGSNGGGFGGGNFIGHVLSSSGNSNQTSNSGNNGTQTPIVAKLLKSKTDKSTDKAAVVNPTTGSALAGPNKSLAGPGGGIIDIVHAAKDKKTADMNLKSAQATSDKAASDLKAANDKFNQANKLQNEAVAAYQANPTEENRLKANQAGQAAYDTGKPLFDAMDKNKAAQAALSSAKVADVQAKSELKDTVLHSVLPGNASSSGQFPSGTGQVITSNRSPMGNSGPIITNIPTTTAPIVQATAMMPIATAPALEAIATGADLVLEDIQLASPATAVAGPAYTVKFRNQGTGLATKFQVGLLVGIDGGLAADAPRGVIEVKSLAAGAASEVTLRLPQTALKLSGKDGRPTAFTHLFVAIDLLNSVAETDETNNTAVVERATLETIAAN